MAKLLTPNAAAKINGVTIREKIIPDGTRWKDAAKAKAAGFQAGSLYKKQRKIGTVEYVTIHNTEDLRNVSDDAEQYTRATYNENMGSARVHYYVDDLGAWQTLKAGSGMFAADPSGAAEVGWHAGDGSVPGGGNMSSIGIEIIMGEGTAHDAKAKDNGARLAAWLLYKHGLTIDKLVTHTFWVTKAAGQTFADVDAQCCNLIAGKKWCPVYIFGSRNEATALRNWKAYKATVKQYLDQLQGTPAPEDVTPKIKVGSSVKLKKGAKTYKGGGLASFVYNRVHKVSQITGDRVVITYGGVVVAAVRLCDLDAV